MLSHASDIAYITYCFIKTKITFFLSKETWVLFRPKISGAFLFLPPYQQPIIFLIFHLSNYMLIITKSGNVSFKKWHGTTDFSSLFLWNLIEDDFTVLVEIRIPNFKYLSFSVTPESQCDGVHWTHRTFTFVTQKEHVLRLYLCGQCSYITSFMHFYQLIQCLCGGGILGMGTICKMDRVLGLVSFSQ